MSASETCLWNQDEEGDMYETSCGKAFVINDGSPAENDMRFCCYCGAALEAKPYVWPSDDEDEP
jgi:hypothetical protein